MIENFINSVRNIFAVPDLRKRVFFTLAMLAVYRVGSHVRTPGIDPVVLEKLWNTSDFGAGLFNVLDLFSGGNFKVVSIFALGITPYITASIILQLMTVVSARLKALQEEGELGRRKINQYTRYLTVVLCAVQSGAIGGWLQGQQVSEGGALVPNPGLGFMAMTILTLATGTTFIMWLGEQITERGVGNGISLIIFAGIVLRLPSALDQIYQKMIGGGTGQALGVVVLIIAMILIVSAIVFVERGFRKVPINHARRMVGRQAIPQQQTHMPLKVNMGGVIPVIFASSMLAFPQTVLGFAGGLEASQEGWRKVVFDFLRYLGQTSDPLHMVIYGGTIIFFTFFYVSIIFNTDEVADNLRKNGAFIPGIRPGKRTSDHLAQILTYLTTVGSLYLAIVALLPQIMFQGIHFQTIPFIGDTIDSWARSNPLTEWLTRGIGMSFLFGGTSLLIVIGVAMDTMNQIESQLIMRHYDGFLGPRGKRLRARRSF